MPVFRNTKSREIYNVPEEEMDSFAASVMDDGIAVERADVFQTRSGRRFLVGEGSRKTFVKQMSDLGMREAAFDTEKNEWYDAVDKANPSIAEADVGLARLTDLNAWKGFTDAQAAEKAEKDARKAKRLSTIVVQDTPSLFFGQNQGATPAGIPSGGRTEPLDQTTPTRDSLGVKPERETIMEVLGEHTRASARGFQGIGASVGRVGQMLFEADDTTALNRWSNKVANYSKFVEDFWVDQAENGWEAPRDDIEAAAWSEKPFTKAASVVGEAGPMMFAAIGAAIATRSAVVPAVMFGLDGGASTYVNAREAGKPIEKSQVLGLLNGAWTAATEKIPFDKALGSAGKGLIKRIASGSFIEPIQELVQTVGSNVVEKFGFDEGRNIMDGWIEAIVGGFFLGGAMSGVVGGGGKSGLQENVEQEVKMNSARDAQLADELRSDAEAAQTIVSDPVAAQAQRDADKGAQGDGSDLSPLKPIEDTPEAPNAAQGRTDTLTATDEGAGIPPKAVTAEKATPEKKKALVPFLRGATSGKVNEPSLNGNLGGGFYVLIDGNEDAAQIYAERAAERYLQPNEGSVEPRVSRGNVDLGNSLDLDSLTQEESNAFAKSLPRTADELVAFGYNSDNFLTESDLNRLQKDLDKYFSDIDNKGMAHDPSRYQNILGESDNYVNTAHKIYKSLGYDSIQKSGSMMSAGKKYEYKEAIIFGDLSKLKQPAAQPKQEAAPVTPKVTEAKAEPKAKEAAEPTPDDNTIKLTHAETAIALEAQGKSPDGKLSKENAEVLQQAKNEGADLKAESLAKTVLNKKTRRAISPVEHAGMVLRAGQVKVEIKRLMKKLDSDIDAGKDTSEDEGALETQQDLLTDLMLASDRAGSEAGRALQIRKIRIELETFTLENMAQRLKAAKKEALSPKEIKEVARLGKVIEAQEAEIKRLQDEIKDIGAKGEADAIVEHARKTRVKRKQDDIAKERKSLKEQLQSLGYRVNDITGTPALTLEAAKIIRKLALNYVDGGVNSLAEVRRLVQQDIPDLSDKGVYDSIGGRIQRIESRVVAEAKTESKEITRQAKLKGQIMDAYNKVFDPKRKTEPTSEEVTALKKQLAILEAAYRKTEFDQDTYDRKVNAIRDMRAQLDGLYRDIKPQKRKKDKLIRKAEAELARLTKKMAKTDELADLSEQIRTGKFKKPAISEDSKSPELDALRQSILHAREQIARITKGEAMKGKSDASTIESIQKSLAEVQKQIDDGYRKLPLPEKARSARVAEVKQDLKEALALRETLDRQEELKRRIRERDFAVTAKESVAIKSKQLAEARIKMAQLQREARALEFRVRKKTFGEKFANVASFPRSMLATLDMSYALRQALLPSIAHPKIAANAFGKAFKSFLSQNSYDAIDLDLKNHPDRPDFDKYGIYFSSIDAELGQREEFFMSTLAEKLPGVLRSERNMVTGLNLLRAGLMSDFLGKHPNASEEAKHAYARYVNIATGRGDLGKLTGAGEALASAFFAPRFAVSRIQVPYEAIAAFAKHPELRGELGKQWGALLTTGLGVLWLGSMAGASVGLDPDDSDWGKLVIGGNKHIDLWGGTQQPMRLLVKALKGMATGDGDSLKDIGRFLRYKLAPSVALVSEQQTGKDAIGRKVEPHALGIDMPWRAASLLNSVTPLIIQSAVEAVRAGEDPLVVAGLVLGEGLGLSIGVYDKEAGKKIKRPKRR